MYQFIIIYYSVRRASTVHLRDKTFLQWRCYTSRFGNNKMLRCERFVAIFAVLPRVAITVVQYCCHQNPPKTATPFREYCSRWPVSNSSADFEHNPTLRTYSNNYLALQSNLCYAGSYFPYTLQGLWKNPPFSGTLIHWTILSPFPLQALLSLHYFCKSMTVMGPHHILVLTLSLLSSKSVFSQPFKKRLYESRICSIITFHLSKLWKVKFSILCDVTFLVRLQGNFDIGHSQEWKG